PALGGDQLQQPPLADARLAFDPRRPAPPQGRLTDQVQELSDVFVATDESPGRHTREPRGKPSLPATGDAGSVGNMSVIGRFKARSSSPSVAGNARRGGIAYPPCGGC